MFAESGTVACSINKFLESLAVLTSHMTVLNMSATTETKTFFLAWSLLFIVQQIISCLKKIHNVLKHSAWPLKHEDIKLVF